MGRFVNFFIEFIMMLNGSGIYEKVIWVSKFELIFRVLVVKFFDYVRVNVF